MMRNIYKSMAASAVLFLAAGIPAQGAVVQAGDKDGSVVRFDVIDVVRESGRLDIPARLDISNVNLKGNRELVLTPMVVNGGDTVRLESITIAGRNRYYYLLRNNQETPLLYKGWGNVADREEKAVAGNGVAVSSEGNGVASMVYSTLYQPWMETASVELDVIERGCANCKEGEQEYTMGVMDFVPKAYEAEFLYVTPVAEAVKLRELSARAFIDFPVNQTVIYPDYRRNPQELAKIVATIDSVKNDKDITVTSLHIAGTASPEGPYSNNVRLAKGRTEALMNYVQNLYHFPKGFITSSYEPVDWAGLRDWLENNTIENGAEILSIVNGELPPEQRNSKIRSAYPKQYKWLLENVYPALRHSDYRINFEIKTYTEVAEILEVMETSPQKLSLAELFVAAQSQPEGSELYNEAFEIAVRMYPDDPVANLNAGTAAMKRGDYSNAERFYSKAGDREEVKYQRAVLTALKGDREKALEEFRKLERSNSPEVAEKARKAVEQLEAIKNAKTFIAQ